MIILTFFYEIEVYSNRRPLIKEEVMVKKAALVFGVVFFLIGVLGFVPALAPKDDMGMPLLLGLFMVGALHNVIHLASGVLALAASKSDAYAANYFRVFGVVYALVAVVGFVQGDTVLGLIHVNLADNLLHLVIALASLYLGFAAAPMKSSASPSTAR